MRSHMEYKCAYLLGVTRHGKFSMVSLEGGTLTCGESGQSQGLT